MLVVANGVMVVGKDSHRFDNGDMQYRVTLTNGQGDTVRCVCDVDDYNDLVALDGRYDMEIDVYMSGYRVMADLVGYEPVKTATAAAGK